MAKKVDMVKNGNHCSKFFLLGYLLSKLCGFNKRKDLRLKDEIRVTSEKTYFNLQFSIVLLTKKTKLSLFLNKNIFRLQFVANSRSA